MPRLSVVIPAYNATRTIEETIRSVLAQTERDFELIVVDDGSSDDTRELVAGFERGDERVTLVAQENQGTAGARNTGIARAQAKYVSFLDNDDLWMPAYLERMARALDQRTDAGLAYCDAWRLDDATMRLRRRTELTVRPGPETTASLEEQLMALIRTNFVMSSATARRVALDAVGGFDVSIRGTDDYDLWLRLMLAGYESTLASPEPLLLQRDRHDSQSKDILMMDKSLHAVLSRAAADPRLSDAAADAIAAQLRTVEREIRMVASRNPLRRGFYAARATAVAVRDSLRRRPVWYEEPPPEVRAAFPTLAA